MRKPPTLARPPQARPPQQPSRQHGFPFAQRPPGGQPSAPPAKRVARASHPHSSKPPAATLSGSSERYNQSQAAAKTPSKSSWYTIRRGGLLLILSLLSALFLIAVLQGVVTQTQVKIDHLQVQVEAGNKLRETLTQRKTELTSPGRIVQTATERLGMTTPTTVVYLHAPKKGE